MNKIQLLTLSLASCFTISSCTTTYDAAGRPVQSVDPGAAAVGIVAAGLIGAAIASNKNNSHRHRQKHYNQPRHCGHSSPVRSHRNRHYSHAPAHYGHRGQVQQCRSVRGYRHY